MKLIVQPRDGLTAFLTAIRLAKTEIDITIFRCDRSEVAKALDAAVKRGVKVRALIAHTARGGEKRLRKLEQHLLEIGACVVRTGDEFARYHGKFMVVDRATLWLLGFNLTALDADSRSFGIVTKQRRHVQQAIRLFEGDCTRQPYEPGSEQLVVSPENARAVLSDFIRRAKKQLLIYDPKVSDGSIAKLLKERASSGVDIRVIGKVEGVARSLPHEKYPGKRLHVRTIIRDGREAFVGSQSLRKPELDKRREVGILVRDAAVVGELARTFEEDWALTDSGKAEKRAAEVQADTDLQPRPL